MTLDEVESEAKQVEDENVDDGLTGVFYYGPPLDRHEALFGQLKRVR